MARPAPRATIDAMAASFLLVRGADHVLLGVSWRGFELVAGPALRAGPGAVLTLTFPPQHIAEQVVEDGPPLWYGFYEHLGARLANPSQVAFTIPADTAIALTAEGILGAVRGAAVVSGETAIELPWRLVTSPESGTGGAITCEHESSAPGAEAGLWRTAVRADGLVLRSVDAAAAQSPDPANFRPALNQAFRGEVHRHAAARPAPCQRLELSSLGGSLSVRADWGALGWEHLAYLGRDVRVRTVSKCCLWPFGHRAEYVVLTERVYMPWTPSIMALKQTHTIVVTEQVRTRPADPVLARAFPFTEVEITEPVVTNLDAVTSDTIVKIPRPTPDHEVLAGTISQKRAEFDQAEQAAVDALYGPGHTASEFAPASVEEVLRIGEIGPDGWPIQPIPEVQRWIELRDEIRYLENLLGGLVEQVPLYFWPTRSGQRYQFRIRCAGARGDLHLRMPLMVVFDERRDGDVALPAFHTLTFAAALDTVDTEWARVRAGEIELPGTPVDLVGAGVPTDVQEVRRLNVFGTGYAETFAPTLGRFGPRAAETWAVEVSLPAVRALQGREETTRLRYADPFLQQGTAEDVALTVAAGSPKVGIDFVGRSMGSGGLIAPKLEADAISRAHGLVQSAAALPGGSFDPKALMGAGATLLGVEITELIDDQTSLSAPPAITQAFTDGRPPEVRMVWEDVPLKTHPPFVTDNTRLKLSVVSGPRDTTTTTCSLTAFQLHLPTSGEKLLELGFASLEFVQRPEREPTLTVGQVSARFVGLLALLQELQNKVRLGDASPTVDVRPSGIIARYSLPVPSVACGVFALRNILFAAAVEVPFDNRPVGMTLAFASRANPFNLSVLMFGGGGYLEMTVDSEGLQRLEASLEFGASLAVNFGIASAEVHAMGGIRYLKDGGGEHLTGFLRLGGSIDLLGLISVSVEVRLELTYDRGRNRMVGRATLVVEIDLTFYSDSVELDSGEWEFIGGGDPAGRPMGLLAGPPQESSVDTWRRYRAAFAEVAR